MGKLRPLEGILESWKPILQAIEMDDDEAYEEALRECQNIFASYCDITCTQVIGCNWCPVKNECTSVVNAIRVKNLGALYTAGLELTIHIQELLDSGEWL